MEAIITILGLYHWDDTIMDGWTLPEGVDRETLIAGILQECSELESVIPNPELFKRLTNFWSVRKQRAWTRALAAMTAEYNPIENYDRKETAQRFSWGTNGASAESDSTTNDDTTHTRGPGMEDERQVSAYDQTTYSPKEKTVYSGSESTERDGSSDLGSETKGQFANGEQNEVRAHGNIGVTTNMKMVEDELRLSRSLDIYNIIIADFRYEFCVMVY